MFEIIREAKIFEAGNYPDRGVVVTLSDLDRLISGTVSASIMIEHSPSAFDGALGIARDFVRRGKELFCKLAFTVEGWALVQSANARRLSVNIDKAMTRIIEVSIVRDPRVVDAMVYSDLTAECFSVSMPLLFTDVCLHEGGSIMDETVLASLLAKEREAGKREGAADVEAQFSARLGPIELENARLKREKSLEFASGKIATLKAEGKLCPAAEKYALALLVDGSAEVTFSDGGHMSASEAFVQFMAYQAPVIEVAGGSDADRGSEFSADDKRLFDALGVTEDEVLAAEKGGN